MIMAGTMIWNVIAAIITGIYVFFLSIQVNSLTTSFFRSGLIMVIVFFVTYVVRWGLGYISGKQPTQSSEMLNENDPGQNERYRRQGKPEIVLTTVKLKARNNFPYRMPNAQLRHCAIS